MQFVHFYHMESVIDFTFMTCFKLWIPFLPFIWFWTDFWAFAQKAFRPSSIRFWADVARICRVTKSECKASFLLWWFLTLHSRLWRTSLCFTLQGCLHLWNTSLGPPEWLWSFIFKSLQCLAFKDTQTISCKTVLGLMSTSMEGKRLSKGVNPRRTTSDLSCLWILPCCLPVP